MYILFFSKRSARYQILLYLPLITYPAEHVFHIIRLLDQPYKAPVSRPYQSRTKAVPNSVV